MVKFIKTFFKSESIFEPQFAGDSTGECDWNTYSHGLQEQTHSQVKDRPRLKVPGTFGGKAPNEAD